MPEPTNETLLKRWDYYVGAVGQTPEEWARIQEFISEERKRAHSEGYKQGYQDGVDNFVKKVNSYAQSLGLSVKE